MTKNMKKCYLDSNILIAFQDKNSPFYSKAKEILIKLVKQEYGLYISPLVVDEFLFQTKRLLQVDQKEVLYSKLNQALEAVLELPDLKIVNAPSNKNDNLRIVELMRSFDLRPRDAYHLLIIRKNKINHLATFDDDFNRVFESQTGVKNIVE